jgi:DNA-binding transcriptional LysR family regulator
MLNKIDLSRFDLNLLVLFEAVFEERHVTRAATRLNLTPSAVSHGLGRLRTQLGDPLFLRNPRGVAPTERAEALAGPIAEILRRVRGVVQADGFDAAKSRRRFVIGAPDAVAAVVLPALIQRISVEAPGIDIAARDVLPPFADAFDWLDQRRIDLALLPVDDAPARFSARVLYEEGFVIAMRAGHPLAKAPTLKAYCAARHVVMSHTGDPRGNVDMLLEERGLARRVAMVAANFMLGMAIVSETDLVIAAPDGLVRAQARRLGLVSVAPPLPVPKYRIRAITPHAAMEDAGIAWLTDQIAAAAGGAKPKGRGRG